jgi:hypothetical protein
MQAALIHPEHAAKRTERAGDRQLTFARDTNSLSRTGAWQIAIGLPVCDTADSGNLRYEKLRERTGWNGRASFSR